MELSGREFVKLDEVCAELFHCAEEAPGRICRGDILDSIEDDLLIDLVLFEQRFNVEDFQVSRLLIRRNPDLSRLLAKRRFNPRGSSVLVMEKRPFRS